MLLALSQFNSTVGDAASNVSRMLDVAHLAAQRGVDLLVFPELAVSGYPPKDLVLAHHFVDHCHQQALRFAHSAPKNLTIIVGAPLHQSSPGPLSGVSNALLALRNGAILARYNKRLLPTYDVFDEDRYFVPGSAPVVIDVPTARGPTWRVGLSVCEDLWRGQDVGFNHRYADLPDPVAQLVGVQPDSAQGAELIVNPSASPFVLGKGRRHRAIVSTHATTHAVHVAAVNAVGGNDELIFDGHACVYSPLGHPLAFGTGFSDDLVTVTLDKAPARTSTTPNPPPDDPLLTTSDEELLYRALVLGVRDYARKTGFTSCVLGLSGGIDSAVTCVIAAAAMGAANVHGVSLPSRYSSDGSKTDAAALAASLGVHFTTVPIEDAFLALERSLQPAFAGRPADVTEENLQSRVRGTILMAISNKFGRLLLTTGNKSELAVGYCTLYGDMNGGLAVLSDVSKHWVYRLAEWINAHPDKLAVPGVKPPAIPVASITKPPSAELRPNQTDQDTLPPYDVLDDIISRYVEQRQHPDQIVSQGGHQPAVVAKIVRLIDLSEFKRKQAAIGLKVSGVAFGSGRRMPIAQAYKPAAAL